MTKAKIFRIVDLCVSILFLLGLLLYVQPMDILVLAVKSYVSVKFFCFISALLVYVLYFYAVKTIINRGAKMCLISSFCVRIFKKLFLNKTKEKKSKIKANSFIDEEVAPIIEDEEVAPIFEDEVVAPIIEDEVAPIEDEVAPIEDEVAPIIEDEEVAPIIDEEVAPIIEDEVVAPIIDEEVAPIIEDEVVAPIIEDKLKAVKAKSNKTAATTVKKKNSKEKKSEGDGNEKI